MPLRNALELFQHLRVGKIVSYQEAVLFSLEPPFGDRENTGASRAKFRLNIVLALQIICELL